MPHADTEAVFYEQGSLHDGRDGWFGLLQEEVAAGQERLALVVQPNSDLGVDLALESTQCFFDVYDTLLSTYSESG